MKFKATKAQVYEMITNAINASSPMGMGFLHFINKTYSIAEIRELVLPNVNGDFHIDYFDGRMVKLSIRQDGADRWVIMDQFQEDYQSFKNKYREPLDLICSVPGTDLI